MLSIFLGMYIGIELLDYMVIVYLTFGGTTRLYPKAAAPFSAVNKGPGFSTSLPAIAIICLFDYSHPGGCGMVCRCGYDLCFPNG